MHQSARLLNHISLFHLRINKIWTLTSAQTLQCRRRDWNLGAWFNDSVSKTGAPPQFLKDLCLEFSLRCRNRRGSPSSSFHVKCRVYDGSFVCSGASVSRLRVSCSSTSSFHSLLPCLFCTVSYIFFPPLFFAPIFCFHSTFPVGLYPPSSSFGTPVELYSNLDL